MPAIVTFDPWNALIIEINSGSPAVNELNAVEIYSEWKQALLDDPARLGWSQAFTPVGGDPRTATASLGTTYFLENGWRIRPAEYSHKLSINGNLFTREGTSIFKPTAGAFNVHTETVVSNIYDVLIGADDARIAAIKTDTTSLLAGQVLQKGALLINAVIDQCVYDSSTPPNLLSSRIRCYATKAQAQDPDHNTPVLTLNATDTYSGGKWTGETRVAT